MKYIHWHLLNIEISIPNKFTFIDFKEMDGGTDGDRDRESINWMAWSDKFNIQK